MEFFFYLGVFTLIYNVIKVLLIIMSDCDIELTWAKHFGKPISILRGKVIWITGASSGIGEHLAMSCAKAGAKLVLSARRQNELERVKRACLEISEGKLIDSDILVLPMDVSNLDSHKNLFDTVVSHFNKIDILVNNAGRSQRAIWEDIAMEVDREMFELNVFGLINLTRLCVKHFQSNGEGHVAVTSSAAGIMGVPFSATYTASKHALHGYFDSLRTEKFLKNISVTMFCPGPTFTNFLQESFTAKPGDKFGQTTQATDKRMTGERCGYLFAVALANKVDEAWVAVYPLIPLYYMNRYYPNALKRILKILGPRFFTNLRDSRDSMKTE